MSHQWIRQRGLANPTPALEPGGVEQNEWDPGADVTLPDDHFSRLHNPQNGRVPPQLPSAITRPHYPDFPEIHYARFFRITPATLNEQMSFQAKSVRLDNFSSHWIYLVSAGMYVPPFTWGAIYPLDPATMVAYWILSPPLGHTDPTNVDSNVISIWYEQMLTPTAGQTAPST